MPPLEGVSKPHCTGSSTSPPAGIADGVKPPTATGDLPPLASKGGGQHEEWAATLRPSRKAARTSNPLRNITDHLKPSLHHGPDKPLLNMSLGDPTVFGNLPPPQLLLDAVVEQLSQSSHGPVPHGYQPSTGALAARRALAAAHSYENAQLTEDDVIITSGGSGALEIAISGLLDEGDALLIPRPGFALYQVIVESLGGIVQPYRLDPDKDWAIDLRHLESLITDRTKAIVLNNPSNPCGSVLPRENLEGLLAIAARHRLPVIADEIYGDMVFEGHTFHPLGRLTTAVPVLTVGGLAKQFAVPGWRVGWILLHDPLRLLSSSSSSAAGPQGLSVKQGLKNLTQVIIGANTLCQAVIPRLFPPKQHPASSSSACPSPPSAAADQPRSRSGSTTSTEDSADDNEGPVSSSSTTTSSSSDAEALAAYHRRYVGTLESNARFVVGAVAADPRFAGRVSVRMPQGAMYAMLRLDTDDDDDDDDDVAFCAGLLQEENVVLLPGQAFGVGGYVRLVLAAPQPMLREALARLAEFVERRHAASA